MKSQTSGGVKDYNPFGMVAVGRNWETGTGYRYGFNGKENTDEVYGDDNAVDFGARIYDARLARWLGVDPKFKKYPASSPYAYVNNNPIYFIDKTGEELYAYTVEDQQLVLNSIAYALGNSNGYKFENNKLIHDASIPENFTSDQQILFQYFNDLVVNTNLKLEFYSNIKQKVIILSGEPEILFENNGGGITYGGVTESITSEGEGADSYFMHDGPKSITIMSTGLIKDGTITVETTKGVQSAPVEMAVWHEWGHFMMDVIESSEYNDNYDGKDFSEQTDLEDTDFSMRVENTVRDIKKLPKATGVGQHDSDVKRTEKLKPLNE